MSINWSAAVTAIIVTLSIEYAAKPWLDVRREHKLERIRTRQRFLETVVDLKLSSEFVLGQLPRDIEQAARRNFQAQQQRHYQRLNERVQHLFDNAGRYAGAYPGPVLTFVSDYITCLHGVMLSARPRHRQAQIISDLAMPIAVALSGSRWRPMARVRAIQEVRRMIEATWEKGDAPHPERGRPNEVS